MPEDDEVVVYRLGPEGLIDRQAVLELSLLLAIKLTLGAQPYFSLLNYNADEAMRFVDQLESPHIADRLVAMRKLERKVAGEVASEELEPRGILPGPTLTDLIASLSTLTPIPVGLADQSVVDLTILQMGATIEQPYAGGVHFLGLMPVGETGAYEIVQAFYSDQTTTEEGYGGFMTLLT